MGLITRSVMATEARLATFMPTLRMAFPCENDCNLYRLSVLPIPKQLH